MVFVVCNIKRSNFLSFLTLVVLNMILNIQFVFKLKCERNV